MSVHPATLRRERFYSWYVDVDTNLTRLYRLKHKARSTTCKCDWCANWRAAVKSHLPTSLKLALRRLGIDPTREDDVYQQAEVDAGLLYRAEFTSIGKIVSGPRFWVFEDRAWHPYPRLIRGWPHYLGVGVTTRDGNKTRLDRWTPRVPAFTVELRIALPWVLSRKMPSIHAT